MLINNLKTNPKNPRTIGNSEFARLKEKIKNFPQMLEKRPIVYDEDLVVLGGNQRLRVLRELIKEGFEVKPSYFKSCKGWTEEQKRQFVITDNVTDGDWDYDSLANEWSDLPMGKSNTKNIDKDPKTGHFVNGNKYSFKYRPEVITHGYWKSKNSISYQYKHLIKKTVDKFVRWLADNPKDRRTIAQELAYQAVVKARKDLQYLKEVTDRTEGKVTQGVDLTTKRKSLNVFEDEQIEKIARRRVASRRTGDGNTSS